MLPLTLAPKGETLVIQKVGGSAEAKKHLEDLGFVVGGNVIVVSENGGNLIVNVKESRIALDKVIANKIKV